MKKKVFFNNSTLDLFANFGLKCKFTTDPLQVCTAFKKNLRKSSNHSVATQNQQECSHLVHVDVVEVRRVVDGLEEALQLAGRPPVDHQHEGDPHRPQGETLGGVLVPLDVGVGFTCRWQQDGDKSVCWFD